MTDHLPRNAARRTPPGGRRVSAAEVERRLRFVVRMLADGRCRAAIVVACKERFRVGERTVDDYLARMREAWTKRHVASVHSSIRACSSA